MNFAGSWPILDEVRPPSTTIYPGARPDPGVAEALSFNQLTRENDALRRREHSCCQAFNALNCNGFVLQHVSAHIPQQIL